MEPEFCPDTERLRDLLLGRLPAANAAQLEEHLLRCESCVAVAETLKSDDDLTKALQSRPNFPDSSEVVAAVVRRAQALASDVETVARLERQTTESAPPAVSHSSGPERSDDAHCSTSSATIDFLRPAERPDEIGRLGGYRILEPLGQGGMGVVFRAEDPHLQRIVALKVMNPALASVPSAKDRFLREARAMATLEHEHIVPVFQVGEDNHLPFFAMQYLKGESLQARLDRDKRIATSDAVRIGRQIAHGLDAAHGAGLIHRDVKPDNIWLDEHTDRARLLDFGLVRGNDEIGLTQSGMVLGTPKYMAPEQADGDPIDARCDLFSLGCVLYHAVSGHPPFQGANVTAVLIAVSQLNFVPIRERCPDLPPDLSNLISRLMARNPDDRPPNAASVAAALADATHSHQPRTPTSQARDRVAKPKTSNGPRLPSPRWTIYGVGALAVVICLLLWASATLLQLRTKQGTILVEIDGGEQLVEVDVSDGDSLQIVDPNDDELIDVQVDREHGRLQLEKSGYQVALEEFDLGGPDGQRVHVRFVPMPVHGRRSGKHFPQPSDKRTIDPGDGWVDLLAHVDLNRDVPYRPFSGGQWRWVDGALRSPKMQFARVRVPLAAKYGYRLRSEFVRREGADAVDFFLPVATRQVMFVVDGFGGVGVSGLQAVKKANLPIVDETGVEGFRIENGKRYRVEFEVSAADDQATITANLAGVNGEKGFTFAWTGPIADLSLMSHRFDLNDSRLFGLAAWESEVDFYRFDFMAVTESAEWEEGRGG